MKQKIRRILAFILVFAIIAAPIRALAAYDEDEDDEAGDFVIDVVITEADGKAAYAPSDGSVAVQGGGVSRNIDGNKKVVLRTSAYAKFANDAMPTGKVDITGVFSRYNTTWQILMRTANDIKPAE